MLDALKENTMPLVIVRGLLEKAGFPSDEIRWTDVSAGKANFVYKVVDKNINTMFVKYGKLVRDKSVSGIDPNRITAEFNALNVVNKLNLPTEIQVPSVLYFDRANQLLVISDATPSGASNLEVELKNRMPPGRCCLDLLAFFLAIAHDFGQNICNKPIQVSVSDQDHWKKWIALRTIRTASPNNDTFPKSYKAWTGLSRNALRELLCELHDELLSKTRSGFFLIDPSPKNFLIAKNRVGAIDFELACSRGHPAYDLGCLLGQVLIFALISDSLKPLSQIATAIYGSYEKKYQNGKVETQLDTLSIRMAGAMILYRSIGVGKAKYIRKESIPFLSIVGTAFLRDTPDIDQLSVVAKGVWI